MMRRRGSLLVAVSLVLGILAALGANAWVSGRLNGETEGRVKARKLAERSVDLAPAHRQGGGARDRDEEPGRRIV